MQYFKYFILYEKLRKVRDVNIISLKVVFFFLVDKWDSTKIFEKDTCYINESYISWSYPGRDIRIQFYNRSSSEKVIIVVWRYDIPRLISLPQKLKANPKLE